jgi:hypothetical protein
MVGVSRRCSDLRVRLRISTAQVDTSLLAGPGQGGDGWSRISSLILHVLRSPYIHTVVSYGRDLSHCHGESAGTLVGSQGGERWVEL